MIPCVIWRGLNSHSGLDVSNIVQAAEVFHDAEKIETREKTLNTIVQVMHRCRIRPCACVRACVYVCVSLCRSHEKVAPQHL